MIFDIYLNKKWGGTVLNYPVIKSHIIISRNSQHCEEKKTVVCHQKSNQNRTTFVPQHAQGKTEKCQ